MCVCRGGAANFNMVRPESGYGLAYTLVLSGAGLSTSMSFLRVKINKKNGKCMKNCIFSKKCVVHILCIGLFRACRKKQRIFFFLFQGTLNYLTANSTCTCNVITVKSVLRHCGMHAHSRLSLLARSFISNMKQI